MKHTKKKRLLAIVLCMILVLSTGIAAFANENVGLQSVACQAATLERVIKNAEGEDVGTLIADIPEGTFLASSSDANIQMDVQADVGADGVLDRVQQQLEANGETGYTLNNYVMADVTFYVNGEKQVPQQPITFHVSGTSIDTENVMAFADDRQNTTTLMDADTDENGALQFTAQTFGTETVVCGVFDVTEAAEEDGTANDAAVMPIDNPASGYRISTTQDNVTLTVEHYVGDKKLYRDTTINLTRSKIIDNIAIASNYNVSRVVLMNGNNEVRDIYRNEVVTENSTYRVYYTAKTETTTGSVQMFDYQVKGENDASINNAGNYDAKSTKTTRFASGIINGNRDKNKYDTTVNVGNNTIYINTWNTNSKNNGVNNVNGKVFGNENATTGIISGVDYATGALKMNKNSSGQQMYEPGFFTRDTKSGKQVLDGYKLQFSRTGDTYTMTQVNKPSGERAASSGDRFFPLNNLQNPPHDDANDSGNNDYFGMRYDIQFKIGDYLGDLNYKFTDDDDLWVVLDAKKNGARVIVDLGGIHSALTKEVDIWNALFPNKDRNSLTDAERNETHTLTVLYMERGAYASNCNMEFTLPNSTIITPSTVPTADLKLTKVNTSGNVISGAEFSVTNDSNQNDTQTVTSGTDGKLTFTGLQQGSIYTLSEVSVPSPYVRTTTTWKVKLEGSPLRAVLYDSTGTVQQTLDATDGTYHIVNSTQEDIVSQSVESNKTVSVKNYNKRTYQIDLTASSKATQTVTTTTPYDIVLVLDQSTSMNQKFVEYTKFTGTMNAYGRTKYYVKTKSGIYQELTVESSGWPNYTYTWSYTDSYTNKTVTVDTNTTDIYVANESSTTKLNALQTAAKQFVSNVAEKNPDCRVGIVTFADSGSIKTITNNKYTLAKVGSSKDSIDSVINNLRASGNTIPATGLNTAKSIFDNASKWESVEQNTGRKQMVVFLTDGVPAPRGTDDFNEGYATAGVASATELKSAGVDIFALGIFGSAASSGYMNNATVKRIDEYMEGIASGQNKYMTADSVGNLSNLFDSITNNMAVSVTATITDVIDRRFELTNGEKERLKGRGATVTENPDKTTTVTWTNTTVNSKTGNTPGWHETIEIKAKDDFIGGNMIPTNGPASGITVGDNTKLFPQPSVNVKLLTPSIGNKEITYYKGDTIESSKFSGELLGTYKITKLDGKTAVDGIPQLTAEQLNKLKNGEEVKIPYSYTNSKTDIEGEFVYKYKNKKFLTENSTLNLNPLKNHPATKVGQDVEEYQLTVTFVPKTVAERKVLLKDTAVLEPNTDASISGTVVNSEKMSVIGTYKVHVLALWAIVKQSTSTDSAGNHPMLSGAKFELLKGSDVYYKGNSNSDGFVEWYKDEKKVSLSEMEKGTYTLRETSAPAGYAKSEVQWKIEITDTSVTIKGANGNNITPTQLQNTGKTYDAYVYENTPVYALPSTGGKGIFLYMIGGMLLMGAAAWILYKNKRREVLKR